MSKSNPSLTADQREIVELLCAELAELMSIDITAIEDINELLDEYSQQLEQLGNAMHLAGLAGMSLCCHQLQENFAGLKANADSINAELMQELPCWPLLILNYLHCFLESEASAEDLSINVTELLKYLSQSCWPQPITAAQQEQWQSQLLHVTLINSGGESQLQQLPEDADSLEIAADVRSELLQSLLIELPGQGRVFEKSIADYLKTQELESLSPAQRIAHTIKGSANIVGIQGLATLMHLSEDLLETISKTDDFPQELADILMDTADCLGDTIDYLTKKGPKPTQLGAILDTLLKVMLQITDSETNAESVETGRLETPEAQLEITDQATTSERPSEPIESNQPVEQQSAEQQSAEQQFAEHQFPEQQTTEQRSTAQQSIEKQSIEQQASNQAALESTANEGEQDQPIAVPQKSAEQLLRIAGEFQISNTQIMSQLEAMQASMQQTENYHRRIKSMAMELEALLQTQNALRSAIYRSHSHEHDKLNNNASVIPPELDPLEMESYSELHSFSNQLLELTADSYEAVSHITEQINGLYDIAYVQRQLNRDNNDLLLQAHMVKADSIVPRLQRCVRQVCRLTGKQVELQVSGNQLLVDNRVLSRIVDPLMHLLRNAVDHGIESTESRTAIGKAEQGTITVEFQQLGELLNITITDDGCGLDYDNIKDKARRKSLIDATQELDKAQLTRLLFLPGFSTRDSADQTSGRGIGLDVVQTEVKALKGVIQLTSEPGEGCRFVLSLPASILTAHALLIKNTDGSTFSILSRGIEQVIYVEPQDIEGKKGSRQYKLEEEIIPVFTLQDLASVSTHDDEIIGALLITRRSDHSQVAIAVPAITASQDLVIKPLNRLTYHPPGVVGATILGDGTVSPVINVHDLPRLNMSAYELQQLQRQRETMAAQQSRENLELPLALVVDDSYSARHSLSQFISELGMRVRTAKDGFEAISVLESAAPNVILVDLEMPRMNGLEFTAHLRSHEEHKDLPVIMITSRSTDKHRVLAAKAGVDLYLNKPWSDETLLTSIQQVMAKNSEPETARIESR